MSEASDRSNQWQRWSVLLWGLVIFTITAILWGTYPNGRTVAGLYRDASQAWWAQQGLYTGPGGMNYLPHFVILFSPFQWMPRFAGELLWRWVSVGCLIFAWWKLVSLADPSRKGVMFFGSSAIAVAACGDAFRSGQANTVFAAMVLLTACYLIERRWRLAAIALMLAMAVKPLGLVLAALVFIGYRPMIRPLILASVGFAIFPFCFGPPDYVIEQFQEAWTNLVNCSLVTDHRFADVNGILRSLGWDLSGAMSQAVRVGCGAVTALIWMVLARQAVPLPREFALLALAVSYLMLFNPMTEVNSYVIMAPVFAILGMYLVGRQDGRVYGVTILLGVLAIGILPEMVRRVAPHFGLWWDPLVTMISLFAVLWYAYGSWRKDVRLRMAELVRDLHLTNDRIGA